MTTYPFHHIERFGDATLIIDIPARFGVPEVDVQVDQLAVVQERLRLAEERSAKADEAVRDTENAARQRLIESLSNDDYPDLSGDVEVTNALLTAEAARRITDAAREALRKEARAFFDVLAANRDAVRAVLWIKVVKSRDTLAGAAFAAEQAFAQLEGSAGLVAALDLAHEGKFAVKPYGGRVETSLAGQQAKEALAALNAWMEAVYEPAPKKETPKQEKAPEGDADDDFFEEVV